MIKVIRGVIHGKTIELSEELGLAEGEQVEVQVRAVNTAMTSLPAREGNQGEHKSAAGIMAATWSAEDDQIFADLQRDRKIDSRNGVPE